MVSSATLAHSQWALLSSRLGRTLGGAMPRGHRSLRRHEPGYDANVVAQHHVAPHEKFGAKKLKLRAISSCGEPLNAKLSTPSARHLILPQWIISSHRIRSTHRQLQCHPDGSQSRIYGASSPGYRMAIIDEQGNELPVGEVGFIAKRADADCRYWLKYWNDPAASSALLIEGWIVTRDLGRIDEEGYFWFEGRADDMIKSSGYRIGPFEVESALLKHPAVAEAAVIGQPDEMRGRSSKHSSS